VAVPDGFLAVFWRFADGLGRLITPTGVPPAIPGGGFGTPNPPENRQK